MDELHAARGADGKPRWVGSTSGFPFLPQLPDEWAWSESRLSRLEVERRLRAAWDSDVDDLKIGRLAQRSERIGMQGWFGERVGPGAGPDGRRYAPELHAATFAWIPAEEAHGVRRVATIALIVALVAALIAVAGVVVRAASGGGSTSASPPTATSHTTP